MAERSEQPIDIYKCNCQLINITKDKSFSCKPAAVFIATSHHKFLVIDSTFLDRLLKRSYYHTCWSSLLRFMLCPESAYCNRDIISFGARLWMQLWMTSNSLYMHLNLTFNQWRSMMTLSISPASIFRFAFFQHLLTNVRRNIIDLK